MNKQSSDANENKETPFPPKPIRTGILRLVKDMLEHHPIACIVVTSCITCVFVMHNYYEIWTVLSRLHYENLFLRENLKIVKQELKVLQQELKTLSQTLQIKPK